MQELIRVVFELHGRVYRTVFYLLTRPGFLTREYFQGRRTSYTPPLHLFLVISIGFFLLVGVVTSISPMQTALVEAPLEVESATSDPLSPADTTAAEASNRPQLFSGPEISGEKLEQLRNAFIQIQLPFLSDQQNKNLAKILFTQAESNLLEVMDSPREFFLSSLEYTTVFMLLMMPILALMQRILFLFSRHYYVEHLVLTLLNHAFLILNFFVILVLGVIADLEIAVLSPAFDFLNTILGIWMFLYLYLSLKRC